MAKVKFGLKLYKVDVIRGHWDKKKKKKVKMTKNTNRLATRLQSLLHVLQAARVSSASVAANVAHLFPLKGMN